MGVQRAYYVCAGCEQTTYPLDERLELAEGKEQGRLREKVALVAVLAPYHQAPQVCQTLLGSERHASGLRRVALREAQQLSTSTHRHTLPQRERERIYLQVDGQLCPTREPRQSAEDQGYREAKAVVAFSQHEVAEMSKERHEILHKVLQAKITDCEDLRGIFAQVYEQARGDQAAEGRCQRVADRGPLFRQRGKKELTETRFPCQKWERKPSIRRTAPVEWELLPCHFGKLTTPFLPMAADENN